MILLFLIFQEYVLIFYNVLVKTNIYITKAEIVNKIALQLGMDKNSVLSIVESYMETVKYAVSKR